MTIFQSLLDFAELYIDDTISVQMGITLLVLYLNGGLYTVDFYRLMKRKSSYETYAVMLIPFTVAWIGASLAAILVQVPFPGDSRMEPFAAALEDKQLCLGLLLVPGVYFLLWGLIGMMRARKERKSLRRWIRSCMPDYIFAAGILLIEPVLLAGIGNPWVIMVFLYCLEFLFCKVLLLLTGLLNTLFCMKITVFRWKDNKNPAAFLFRYFLLYQNAVFRSVLLFCLCLPIPLTVFLLSYIRDSVEIAGGMLMCGLIILLIFTFPARNGLQKFSCWGIDGKSAKELFCREYFTEAPFYHDKRYTVTRHFLIDEQAPAAVYYWPCLKQFSGWMITSKGKMLTLEFTDGSSCVLTQGDEAAAEKILAHARRFI